MTRPVVSIIIVNYNVRDFLESTLHSVRKALDGLTGEVFVVDNNSQDGSVAMVREKFPEVRLHPLTENLGFGRANNLAMREAAGEYFLILNPDTVLQEDTLRAMIAFMAEHPDAGMAGCKVLNADGTFQLPCRRGFPTPWASFCKVFGLSALFPKTRLFAGYNLTYLDENKEYPIDAVAGSFMFVRRAVFEQTQGFDEEYFMYGEDLDWCYRTQKRGWQVWYTPRTSIVHYKGESTKRSSIDEVRVFYDAMHIFVRKNFSAPWVFIAFLRAGIAVRSAIAVVLKRRRAIALAMLDALVVAATLLLSTWRRFGSPFGFAPYAYPQAVIVPVGVVLGSLWLFGVYSRGVYAATRAAMGVVASFFIVASLTFFFKEYAFSRRIVLEVSATAFVVLPLARVALRARAELKRHGALRRTVIVGADPSVAPLVRRLRTGDVHEYDIVGLIAPGVESIGRTVADVPVIGSMQTIARTIAERDITDVIFVSDAVPYAEMLAIMQRCAEQQVTFRLVPSNADILVAKSGVDALGDYPLVAFTYNIHKPLHRAMKRAFDVAVAAPALVVTLPVTMFSPAARRVAGVLWRVCAGRMSLVGPHLPSPHEEHLGKPGAVNLGETYASGRLSQEQRTQFDEYYAKHQSVLLDLNVLIRAARNAVRRRTSGA